MKAIRIICVVWCLAPSLHATGLDEFQVKRQAVFEFARKPTVTRKGDQVTIAFAAKGYCDATVAIEDRPTGSGHAPRIVRHLASGVLGKKAPPPFQKNSLTQTLVWDGKDDRGTYLDDKNSLVIRVSLGLKPQLERSLLWEPRRRTSRGQSMGADSCPAPLIAAAKEGVYVYDGGGTSLDHLRLFDHDGNYVRTVYPFPAAKVRAVKGLTWYTYPQDGRALPLKRTFLQNTLLTSGSNWVVTYNPKTKRFCTTASKSADHMGMWGQAATAIAAYNGRIALAQVRLNRLAADGSSGGVTLEGPKISHRVTLGRTWAGPGGGYEVPPRSAALSPDGKWVYLTGYIWHRGLRYDGLHGVVRASMQDNEKCTVFAGTLSRSGSGRDNAHFHYPTSVACDAKGRVYVADYLNDRVQVYDPGGKHLRSVASFKPAHVAIHHRTGEIYVFSWHVTSNALKAQAAALGKKHGKKLDIPARLTVYGPLEEPKPRASYAIPFVDYVPRVSTYYAHHEGLQYRVCLDSWTAPPTVWLVPNAPGRHNYGKTPSVSRTAIRLLVPKDGKLAVQRDFGREAAQWPPPASWRQRLFVNPKTRKLYVANGGDQFGCLIEIDPDTGGFRRVGLPVAAEDMVFGQDGHAYLRTHTEVMRYEPGRWREVPFDYGEKKILVRNYKNIKIMSCIPLPAIGHWRHGGMWVSPRGRIAVASVYTYKPRKRGVGRTALGGAGEYSPRLYPGRTTLWVYGATYVHVWDRYGKVVYDDAVPGINGAHGVGIDNDDNVYVMVAAARTLGKRPYFNDATCTLMKFRPKKGRIISTRHTPAPLSDGARPKRPPDLFPFPGPAWVEGAEWLYGGVGWSGKKWEGCCCWNARFGLDYFGRTFAPEIDRYRVAVLDTNGNLILRVGRYGNVDDGLPFGKASSRPGEPPHPRSIGGDEVSLFHAPYVATESDRRLFIADPGNGRIVSVKLRYHATETVRLKDVPGHAAER